jgi:hypothetical protein
VLVVGCVLALCGQIHVANGETPGERFRKAIEREAEYCATHKIKPANRRCNITKLQPADPLATEEGRFAHSIKIPNPVPEDSGYKPGMTSQGYFDHLCKTEAGEFIYKTVENVEGLYMMRPRNEAHFEYNHLYALEDPYGHWNEEATEPEMLFVKPSWYSFLETPLMPRTVPDWQRKQRDTSISSPPDKNAKYARYSGYDGQDRRTMQRVYDVALKARYGYVWRGIIRPHDREFGIGGSEVIILDLQTHEVLGVHRGFAKFEFDGLARAHWLKRCPLPSQNVIPPREEFILKVLTPAGSSLREMGGSHATK